MSAKASTKNTGNLKKDIEVLKYLLDCLEEIPKLFEATKMGDPLSMSYTNAKQCALLKGILMYVGKHQVISEFFHGVLTSMLKSIENDVDYFNSFERSTWEKGGAVLSTLFRREVISQSQRLNHCFGILVSVVGELLRKIERKTKEIEALQKQGEKLKGLMEKQRKQAEEKISQYVT